MNSKETLNKVKTLLGLEIKLEERKLENGTRFESEVFEKGKEVFIVTDEDERIPVPAGDYILDDGMMLVVKEDGIIDEVKEEVEEEVKEEVEAPVEEEVEAADEEAEVGDWKGMEVRIKNLEDAIADLKQDKEDKMSSQDLSSKIEVDLSSETLQSINHNPENSSKTEMHTYAQNRPMSTQDRVFAKLFNNN